VKDPNLTKLRRARSRAHLALKRAETLAQTYRDKLAITEAAIQAIVPDLQLPVRLRRANPIFAHGELRRFALDILREAGRPLAIREIALAALATKGIRSPDRRTMKMTRVRVREIMGDLERRGLTQMIGTGRATRRALIER
jgi:hypothetical protein